eukprot:TRINITY_DN1130_c0_g2_i1.p1 TRINITY_DN1130_c0_g2~~TRINITY_DN1130_c0_g2_i1.p1  ORF type:complete len:263 (-),score=71.75 TRINITY_DN1130_c0_g2_i1:64-852(-)
MEEYDYVEFNFERKLKGGDPSSSGVAESSSAKPFKVRLKLLEKFDGKKPFDWTMQGLCLWPGAKLLCDYLVTIEDSFSNMKACELGSGAGLCGVLAAQFFASELILTDGSEKALTLLRENVRFNRKSLNVDKRSLKVTELEWGNNEAISRLGFKERFDIVFGSDLIYQQVQIRPMLTTASMLMKRDGRSRFILSFIPRSQFLEEQLRVVAAELQLNMKEIPRSEFGQSDLSSTSTAPSSQGSSEPFHQDMDARIYVFTIQQK